VTNSSITASLAQSVTHIQTHIIVTFVHYYENTAITILWQAHNENSKAVNLPQMPSFTRDDGTIIGL